jgi:hypothetical protein
VVAEEKASTKEEGNVETPQPEKDELKKKLDIAEAARAAEIGVIATLRRERDDLKKMLDDLEKADPVQLALQKLGNEVCTFDDDYLGAKFIDLVRKSPRLCECSRDSCAGNRHRFYVFKTLYNQYGRPGTPYRKDEFASLSTEVLRAREFHAGEKEGSSFGEAAKDSDFCRWVLSNKHNLCFIHRQFVEFLSRIGH